MPVARYRPRRARASPLWQCLAEHREAFFKQYGARFEKLDGWLRREVAETLVAFEACGDLSRGFARLHCDHCGHDYLIAFSCKQRYFCPSCHQKKVQLFGEFVRRELIQKVWETDPLICPNCGRLMRVTGILEDPDDAAQLLRSLGWLAYATSSHGARAPPPRADPDAPELPFNSELDDIAYELEPWEQARRQRLEAYARQRDEVAGIVLYDGEWNEAIGKPTEADAWPQTLDESQASPFPEDIDQRPPDWDKVWQAMPVEWNQTPLAQWAENANQIDAATDDIDQRQPPEQETQQWDQSHRSWQDTPLARWATEQRNWDGIDPISQDDDPVFIYD